MIKFNFIEKFIINFLFKFSFVNRVLFDFEKVFFKKKWKVEKRLFICGLPRSGTSILLNKIYETGNFASLTYENMPFIMSPLLWRKISKFFIKINKKTERMHGDGIEIDNKSPEAFEEVFWQTFEKKNFVTKNFLKIHDPGQETLKEYLNFIDMVCQSYKKNNFLSKNNTNILRLKKLSLVSGNNTFVVMYRDPLNQAFSLKKQFFNFLNLQKKNKFYQKYFFYLGHYEFGMAHKNYEFLTNISNKFEDDLYWLSKWRDTYSYLININQPNIIFLSYENFCKNPRSLFEKILDKDKIKQIVFDDIKNFNSSFVAERYRLLRHSVFKDCYEIYSQLEKNSFF